MRNKGQALVLVLLSLAVVLTLVLFILARSTTDITVSSRQEEAIRAFSAAEAGVEKALIVGVGNVSPVAIGEGTASYTSASSEYASGKSSFVYPPNMASGDTATIWFVAHDPEGNVVCTSEKPCFTGKTLKVCWGKSGTPSDSVTPPITPAVELSVFYLATPGNFATTKIARAAFDPNPSRASTNRFSSALDSGTCNTIEGETFQFGKTVDLSTDLGVTSYNLVGGLQFARLRMLYPDVSHKVGFDVAFAGNSTLPSQGLMVDSSGSAGQSNRRLEVFQGWPEVPGVFDYAVYSSTGLTK